jgi:hypothetical protein
MRDVVQLCEAVIHHAGRRDSDDNAGRRDRRPTNQQEKWSQPIRSVVLKNGKAVEEDNASSNTVLDTPSFIIML